MSNQLTKAQARAILRVDTDAALAEFFEVSRAAIAQWKEHEPIPELRQLQLERKHPELFAPAVAPRLNDEDNDPHRRPAAEAGDAAETTPVTTPLSEAA